MISVPVKELTPETANHSSPLQKPAVEVPNGNALHVPIQPIETNGRQAPTLTTHLKPLQTQPLVCPLYCLHLTALLPCHNWLMQVQFACDLCHPPIDLL